MLNRNFDVVSEGVSEDDKASIVKNLSWMPTTTSFTSGWK